MASRVGRPLGHVEAWGLLVTGRELDPLGAGRRPFLCGGAPAVRLRPMARQHGSTVVARCCVRQEGSACPKVCAVPCAEIAAPGGVNAWLPLAWRGGHPSASLRRIYGGVRWFRSGGLVPLHCECRCRVAEVSLRGSYARRHGTGGNARTSSDQQCLEGQGQTPWAPFCRKHTACPFQISSLQMQQWGEQHFERRLIHVVAQGFPAAVNPHTTRTRPAA